jgi:hypothetical protein
VPISNGFSATILNQRGLGFRHHRGQGAGREGGDQAGRFNKLEQRKRRYPPSHPAREHYRQQLHYCRGRRQPGCCPAIAQQMTNGAMPNMSPADKSFSSGMVTMGKKMSHAPMTKTELKYGKDPMLRKMAKDIIASQDAEIKMMQAWQAAHPIPPSAGK